MRGVITIRCLGCGAEHALTPTAAALVICAFQDGELTTTSGRILCLYNAFTPERVTDFSIRSEGRLQIDNVIHIPGGFSATT